MFCRFALVFALIPLKLHGLKISTAAKLGPQLLYNFIALSFWLDTLRPHANRLSVRFYWDRGKFMRRTESRIWGQVETGLLQSKWVDKMHQERGETHINAEGKLFDFNRWELIGVASEGTRSMSSKVSLRCSCASRKTRVENAGQGLKQAIENIGGFQACWEFLVASRVCLSLSMEWSRFLLPERKHQLLAVGTTSRFKGGVRERRNWQPATNY